MPAKNPILLYHWSPTRNRASIRKRGLLATRRDRLSRVPLKRVCFGVTPSAAWALSGRLSQTGRWDLWQCWSDRLKEPTRKRAGVGPTMIEWRTNYSVGAKDIWYVGTRMCQPECRRNR